MCALPRRRLLPSWIDPPRILVDAVSAHALRIGIDDDLPDPAFVHDRANWGLMEASLKDDLGSASSNKKALTCIGIGHTKLVSHGCQPLEIES